MAKQTDKKASAAGRWYLGGIGLSLALMGGLFTWLMWRSFERARVMDHWPTVRCVILSSDVEERRIDENSPPEFRVNVSYGYEFAGKPRTGDHATLRGNPWTSKRNVVEKKLEEYPTGTSSICHVNPSDPDFSVLKVDSKAPGYSIWFPMLFVVGGLGIAGRAVVGPVTGGRAPYKLT